MAANAKEDQFENQVAAGVVGAERVLIEKGLTPKEAREMSTFRCVWRSEWQLWYGYTKYGAIW